MGILRLHTPSSSPNPLILTPCEGLSLLTEEFTAASRGQSRAYKLISAVKRCHGT